MAKNNLNDLSDREYYESIGRRVVASQEKRRQINNQMHNAWLAEGQQHKTVRENLAISQAEISKAIKADESVIRRFERGLFVKRRPVIKAAYTLALENICLKRLNTVSSLIATKKDDNPSSETFAE